MKESILNRKCILAINGNPDLMTILGEEILSAAPKCHVQRAVGYHDGFQLLACFTYDLVLLDALVFRSSDLLNSAVERPSPYPVVMTMPRFMASETERRFLQMGAIGCFPNEDLRRIGPFLENVIAARKVPGWKGVLKKFLTRMQSRTSAVRVDTSYGAGVCDDSPIDS